MSGFLLDTNIWILWLKEAPPALRRRMESEKATRIAVCSIVKAELWHGARKYQNADERLRILTELLAPYRSLPFDDTAARHYADIRHQLETQGQIIGPNDLKIAAICRANDLTLVSTNTSEFGRVPGLKVEDWSQTPVKADEPAP